MQKMQLRQILGVIGAMLGAIFGLAACQTDRQVATTTVSRSGPVTQLEQTQQPVTTLETEVAPVTTLTTTQQATTTTTVQQAMTDLAAKQSAQGIVVVLPENILFDFDKYNLRPNAAPTLAKLALLLKNYPQAPVAINGYTDSMGGDAYNQTLSENRAKSVKTYLVEQLDIPANRLQTKGFGKANPVAANSNPDGSDNAQGRQKNRRVEVIIRN